MRASGADRAFARGTMGDRTPLEAGESVSGAFVKTFTVRAGIMRVVLFSRFDGEGIYTVYSLVNY